MNLFVLCALFLIHLAFASDTGPMSPIVFYLITCRFLLLIGEILFLSTVTGAHRQVVIYIWCSTLFNLLFGFYLSYAATLHDSHYHVLMLIPIVAAALYLPLVGLVFAVLAATGLTYLSLFLFYRSHPPTDLGEYFEATTIALIYVLAGAVVWLLVRRLEEKQRQLADHYEQLQIARNRLLEEEKLAAIGRLSSAIAHEIRNPVTVIASALESAARGSGSGDEKQAILELASREATRLTVLTEEFLTYARSRPPERSRLSASDLLNYSVSLVQPHSQKLGIEVVLHPPVNDCILSVDQFQFQQIMQNVLLNALDASPPGNQVVIDTRIDGQLKIAVRNAGNPISGELAVRIFEPFFTTKPHGTGLGLAIARKLATAHGGTLELLSNEPDHICFEIGLPVERDVR
jgi:signal transduction histidine kinase